MVQQGREGIYANQKSKAKNMLESIQLRAGLFQQVTCSNKSLVRDSAQKTRLTSPLRRYDS